MAAGVISPKSTLEPVTRLVWLGKDVDMGRGSLRTAGTAWEAVLAHWLPWSVGVCILGRLRQFFSVRIGSAGVIWGMAPTYRGSGPMCYGDPLRLLFTLLKLLRSICVACVFAVPG